MDWPSSFSGPQHVSTYAVPGKFAVGSWSFTGMFLTELIKNKNLVHEGFPNSRRLFSSSDISRKPMPIDTYDHRSVKTGHPVRNLPFSSSLNVTGSQCVVVL